VIHNGIIENYLKLRTRLVANGAKIVSDTDTEIVAHLIDEQSRQGLSLEDSVSAALKEVEGAYAIVVISESEKNKMVVAKNASPLVLGLGDKENFCASDIPALLQHTNRVIILEDGDMAVVTGSQAKVTSLNGKAVDRPIQTISWSPIMAEKAGYKHFMLKEIFEQPRAIEDTLRGRLDREHGDISGEEIGLTKQDIKGIQRIYLIACGTSYYAGMTGLYYFERLTRVRANLELASEFRGRDPVIGKGDLVVAISQSGETLDTLMAAKIAKEKGAKAESAWNEKFAAYKAEYPELAAEYERRMAGELPADWAAKSADYIAAVNAEAKSPATRQASLACIEAYSPVLPELFGGSADLGCSNLTEWSGYRPMRAATPDSNYINYGVREFAMSAIMIVSLTFISAGMRER
jgi:glucosamine--fructose-6-phosphate aminotransferase (isomerizing)